MIMSSPLQSVGTQNVPESSRMAATLGLSAGRLRHAAHWASWADGIEMIHQRHHRCPRPPLSPTTRPTPSWIHDPFMGRVDLGREPEPSPRGGGRPLSQFWSAAGCALFWERQKRFCSVLKAVRLPSPSPVWPRCARPVSASLSVRWCRCGRPVDYFATTNQRSRGRDLGQRLPMETVMARICREGGARVPT